MYNTPLNERHPRISWLLWACLLALMVIGVAFISSTKPPVEGVAWYRQFYMKQVLWYVVGAGAAAGVCLVDYRSLARWALVAYWITIVFLVSVLIPGIGTTHGWGARRWIDFGPFQMQPSEFAKLALLVAMAHFLSRPLEELRQPSVFLKSLGLTALPFVLILKEPDLGSALVLFPITLLMMLAAGVPTQFLVRFLGCVGLVVMMVVGTVLFAPSGWQPIHGYQRDRLLVFFGRDFADPQATPEQQRKDRQRQKDRTYQVNQALISVGSGGFWGRGWRQGQQINLRFLPPEAAHNDFIFSVIAEEKGFLGSVTVLTLYALILFSGIRIASQARDRLGRLLAVGVVALLFSHVFVNIGMNIRLMPVTGIPLPLLSYGGSSVLCSLIAAGILQNVYLHRRS